MINYKKAKSYLKDHNKILKILTISSSKLSKLKNKKERDSFYDDLKTSSDVLMDWIRGDYKVMPLESLVKLMAGLIYFITPIDLIPDFIVGTGLLDDLTVISFLLSGIKNDLDKYRDYKYERDFGIND